MVLVFPSIITRQIDEIEQLLDINSDMVNSFKYGSRKRTLLHKAAQIGDCSICDLLISRGANVNMEDAHNQTPLWIAANEGHADICNVLIQKDAFIDAMDAAKITPLLIASKKRHKDVCKTLILNGAVETNSEDVLAQCYSIKENMHWRAEYSKIFDF